jgi:alpha-tubulin suppressor-like RCC1 family protein
MYLGDSPMRNLLVVLIPLVAACALDPELPAGGLATLDDVTDSDGYVGVSAGADHACALAVSGSAYCWGSNQYGQLGAASDTTCVRDDRIFPCRLGPRTVDGGHAFQKVSAGGRLTCALTTAGRAYCWGDNLKGGLGEPSVAQSQTPVAIASTASFSDIAAGGEHACAIRSDGVAFCWGSNDQGQLGNGATGSGSAIPVQVSTTIRFVSLAAGERRTCGRQADGATFCWGLTWVSNIAGLEVTRSQSTPQRSQATGAPVFTSVSVGSATTCAITPALIAYCWEGNPAGGMGDGTAAGSTVPRAVSGSLRYVAISSGDMHTCAVDDTGMAHCWGAGAQGQLGISPAFVISKCGTAGVACIPVPVKVSGWRRFTAISAGQGNHSCGLTLNGNVYCWGAGSLGQLGNGRRFSADWAPSRTSPPL